LALSQGIADVDNVYYDMSKKELVISINNVAQPFSNLSDGQRTMAATVADLAIRAVTLNSYLFGNGNGQGYASPAVILQETPGVVLIDEVDVHLHPIWQRSVVKDLMSTFPKVQFICSTHSAQVAGEVDGKSLRIFNPKNGRWETPSQSFGMDSNWILEVLMHGSKMDPEIEDRIKQIQQLASMRDLVEARRILLNLRERVGNSQEIQFAASIIDRIALLGK
jgi:predicted ATP-binding protein involved in virulence